MAKVISHKKKAAALIPFQNCNLKLLRGYMKATPRDVEIEDVDEAALGACNEDEIFSSMPFIGEE
jgi:hypothetical protein